MDPRNNKSAEFLDNCNISHMSANSNIAEAVLTSEPNSAGRNIAKTILEDVCTDFESINVISPKSNKILVIKRGTTNPLRHNNSDQNKSSNIGLITDKATSSNKMVVNEIAESSTLLSVNEVNSQLDAKSVVASEIESLQQSSRSVALDDELEMHPNLEILPSSNYQNPNNITVLPENFAAEENSPLAQLADAEIVQSGDNVSIILTNTRLIKVLTNANNSDTSVQSIIDPTGTILETTVGTTQQIGIIDPAVLADSSFQGINIIEDSSVIGETVISDNLSSEIERESHLTEDQLNILRKHSTPRGRPVKKAFRRSYTETGSSTKARRITAKMKAEWTRQLEASGRLVCEMPGCSQTYVTVANFQTHYKYCTGKKSLQHCLYCDSLIFSSHKAVLHHMEVEHPEKVEEYKAQLQEETTEFEEGGLPTHLIVAEDENVAMNVEEVTQQPQKSLKKRKLSSKENVVSKKVILKHKMQSIQNTVTENIKEFKKCVRFGDIVDKINSVDVASSFEIPSDTQNRSLKLKKERKRIILTESIVAEEKYFEDDEDLEALTDSIEQPQMSSSHKLNTKARMLLNMERYKRYKEYLKLTRDWSSERRTYSRSRTSDTSFDSSYLMQLQNEYVQDIHQLNDTTESSSISLNTSETEINPNVSYLQQTFEALEMDQFVSHAPQSVVLLNEPPTSTANRKSENASISSNEPAPPEESVNFVEKSCTFEPVVKREKTACYNRPSIPIVQNISENLRPKPVKFEGIITYGMTVPGQVNKSVDQPLVTFDSLISSVQQKQVRRSSTDKGVDDETQMKQTVNDDSFKQLGNVIPGSPEPPKRKRGRPPKPKPDQPVQLIKSINNSKNLIHKNRKKNVKKHSSAMLKNIEKNAKNRQIKLFGVKKSSKFKPNSKKSGKNSQLHSKKCSLKIIHKNQLKRKLLMASSRIIPKKNLKHNVIAANSKKHQRNLKRSLLAVNSIINKEEMLGKANLVEESIIQCQENIDNHLPLGNETAHIQSLTTEHNYSHIINSVIEDTLIADANNVATEIEVITSNAENVPESITMGKCGNLNENISVEDINSVTVGIQGSISNNTSSTHLEAMHTEFVSNSCEPTSHSDLTANNAEISSTVSQVIERNETEIDVKDDQIDKEKCSENSIDPLLNANTEIAAFEPVNMTDTSVLVQPKNAKHSAEMQEICAEILAISKDKASPINHVEEQSGNISTRSEKLPSQGINDTEQQLHSQKSVNSVMNQKVENASPGGKIKRPRGRPRKNQNKQSTSDVSCSNKSLQNSFNIGEIDKSKVVSDAKGKQNEVSFVSFNSSALFSDENKPSAIRKSERVKRRKLVNEIFDSPKVEIKKKDEETTPVIRTGRRGRPRKVPLKDSEVSLSDSKTKDVVEKTYEIESESVDENFRKYSRKGRPRKCVRYADLNSGVDSSESLDGLNNGSSLKDKIESNKMRGDNCKKTNDLEEKEIESIENKISYEQDEKIILPLKKRKQRQTKKDDPILEEASGANTSKDVTDPETLLDAEENMKKLDLDSGDDDIVIKKGLKSRNLRNQKNAKLSRKKRMRRNSSDVESEFSNFVNSRNDESYTAPVTRQKSSNLDLLELDEEASDTEKNDPDYSIRKDSSRRLNDTSVNRSNRVSARSIARSKKLESAALKYSSQSTVNVLPDLKPQKCMWNLLSGKDYYNSLPPMKNSVYFKVEKTWSGDKTNWNSLSMFDSAPIDNESCHGTFFTGGPVLCAAWCPTPVDNKVQYVAVAVQCSLNKYHSYVCTDAEKGLLQLWNVGFLHDKTLQSKPALELSISHNYGIINEMVWCPNGCWEDPLIECPNDTLPRLGMLAVACSDSNVRVYSIPHPSFLPKESASFPIYESCPSIILQPMHGEMCSVTRQSMCISLSWQKLDNCERVAAGYGNGMICIWRINTTATILSLKENNHTTISPYLFFNAHGTPVTSVCFAPLPGGRFLVSSSTDKTLKFWDLTDISLPFFAVKKGAARSAEWANHYCGAFASLDHGMNCFKGSSFFKECGTENFPSRLLSNPSCSVIKSTMSEWLNAQAIADMSGCVSVSFIHSLLQEHVKSPQYFHRPVYQTEIKLLEGKIEKIAFSSFSESANCIAALEDMADVVSVANKLIEDVSKVENLNVNSIKEPVEISTESIIETAACSDLSASVNCLTTVHEMKDIVSVMTELTEECKKAVTEDIGLTDVEECDNIVMVDHVEDSGKKEQHRENEELEMNDKLSEMTDVVAAVMDMKDITSTVDQLAVHFENNSPQSKVLLTSSESVVGDISMETSLMEVDEGFVGNQNSVVPYIESQTAQISMREIERSDKNQLSDVLKTLFNLVNILVGNTDVSLEVNDTAPPESKTDSPMPVLENELNSREGTVETIYSDSVTCISTMQEIEDVVSVIDDVIDKCEVFSSNVTIEPDKSDILKDAKTKFKSLSESEFGLLKETADKPSLHSSESVDSVIQAMKDVICAIIRITEESEIQNMNLNEAEEKEQMAHSLKKLLNAEKLATSKETKDKLTIHGTGLPFELSKIADIVECVRDTRDVTVIMDLLMQDCEKVHFTKNQVLLSSSPMMNTDLPFRIEETSVINFQSDLVNKVRDISSEKIPLTYEDGIENLLPLDTVGILHDVIKTVTEKADTELEVKNLLCEMISDLQKEDKLEECENQKLSSHLFSSEKSECHMVLKSKGNFPSTDVCNELIIAKLSTKLPIMDRTDVQCNKHVPPTQIFDHELVDEEYEPMLLADGDSSSSENEMDTEDELEVADSYLFDQKSGFSDDSILSECSLDSMCSSSGESDMSDNSSDSVPDDQELDSSVCYNQNNPADAVKSSSVSPPSLLSLISEISQNLPSRRNTESATLENDSATPNLLDTSKSPKISNDQLQKEITLLPIKGIVPSSNCEETDFRPENLEPVSGEPNNMDTVEISVELNTSTNSDAVLSETLSNVSGCRASENTVSTNSESPHVHTSDVLCVDKSCDKNLCNADIAKNIVNISCSTCSKSIEKSNTGCTDVMYLEKIMQEESMQNILPKTVEKNIFDIEKVPETVVNSDNDEDNEECTNISVENIPVVDNNVFSLKKLCYESLISQYGLSFEDMNTANFENIEDRIKKEKDSLSLDQYHIASVKSIAWNPNYSSHFWLFSAGQSGIARISYVSDINQCKISRAKDGKDP